MPIFRIGAPGISVPGVLTLAEQGACGVGQIAEINTVCPAITPVVGAELGDDGNMEAVGTGSWGASGTPTTLAKSAAQAHGGSQSMNVVVDAQLEGFATVSAKRWATDVTRWVQASVWLYANSRPILARVYDGAATKNLTYSGGDTIGASWTQKLITYREAGGGSGYIQAMSGVGAADADFYADDMYVQPVTATTVYVGQRARWDGNYICRPTVTTGTQCGLLVHYADSNNFVMGIVDRQAGKAVLISRIAGTYTVVGSGNITYGAEKELKITCTPAGNYSLSYDSVQVVVPTAIAQGTLGYETWGFSTYASNTVGLVTTDNT